MKTITEFNKDGVQTEYYEKSEVEQQIKELEKYTRHLENCEIAVLSHPEDCTCGLTELLNKYLYIAKNKS